MRLDVELFQRGLCGSRTEAQEFIEKGTVFVNGFQALKPSKAVSSEDDIKVTQQRKYVSRGGEKLEGVMKYVVSSNKWAVNSNSDSIPEQKLQEFLKGKVALDVGSSTGGFTDFLLQSGIEGVDAVDVGTDQFHVALRNNPQVRLFEKTDIRDYKTKDLYDIVVADLSFIPLKSVLSTIIAFGKQDAFFFLLLKPQFEVGKGNTKKGIVKDEDLVTEVLSEYKHLVEEELDTVEIVPCVIKGGEGNQEYFLVGTKKSSSSINRY